MKTELLIHPEELSEKWIDQMADAGVDVLGLHPTGGSGAADSLKNLLGALETPGFRGLLDRASEKGLEIEYEFHAAGFLLDRALFPEHPAWFRMNEAGFRTPDKNFCVSSEEALAVFSENAKALSKKLYRSNRAYYFWLDDCRAAACHCEKCRKLSASDQQLIAVNAMAKAIRKETPDAKVCFLAYCDTITPPEKVRPEEGVFLEYAPFEKYVSRADEKKKELIAEEERMLEPLLEFFGKENAKILEYWYDNSLFSGWKKPPKKFVLDEAGLKNDVVMYHEKGFSYLSSFACFLGADYEELYGAVDVSAFPESAGKL